jgi:phosphate-selective porin OprO/OprP
MEVDSAGDYAARVFFQPFINSDNFNLRGLGIGIGSTWVDVDGTAANTALSAYRSPGQQSVFAYRANTAIGTTPNNATYANGERLRLAPQFYYYRGASACWVSTRRSSRTCRATWAARHCPTR